MTVQASIPHAVPGRMRLKVTGHPEECARVLDATASRMGAQPGVNEVDVNPRTGSALISYDPDVLDPPAVLALLRQVDAALATVLPPRVHAAVEQTFSQAAQEVNSSFARANRSVLQATHGALDLRMIVPVGLAGLALRQVMTKGLGIEDAPWYVLAYYAFDSFIKLHGDGRRMEQS